MKMRKLARFLPPICHQVILAGSAQFLFAKAAICCQVIQQTGSVFVTNLLTVILAGFVIFLTVIC